MIKTLDKISIDMMKIQHNIRHKTKHKSSIKIQSKLLKQKFLKHNFLKQNFSKQKLKTKTTHDLFLPLFIRFYYYFPIFLDF